MKRSLDCVLVAGPTYGAPSSRSELDPQNPLHMYVGDIVAHRSQLQVFGLAREIRATRGATHEVSVMMLTDGEHNELAVPKWWTGPPPVDGNFPLGTYVHRPDAGWVKSPSNRCTLDGGLARVVPPNTPVTFIGIKVDTHTSTAVAFLLVCANVHVLFLARRMLKPLKLRGSTTLFLGGS